jgi:hypothetical protein
MKDIQPQDIELLTRELNLKETTPTTLEALVALLGASAGSGLPSHEKWRQGEDD